MISVRPALTALWLSLFDNTQRPHRYLGRALLLDLPVTISLMALTAWAFPATGPKFVPQPRIVLFLSITVFSPVVETLLMRLVLFLLRLFVKPMPYVAILSALIWAGFHSLLAPSWGLVIFWPFLIFSLCYLTWEAKSKRQAFWMTASLHALHNTGPGLIVAFFGDY